jgi:hypothetical protein
MNPAPPHRPRVPKGGTTSHSRRKGNFKQKTNIRPPLESPNLPIMEGNTMEAVNVQLEAGLITAAAGLNAYELTHLIAP